MILAVGLDLTLLPFDCSLPGISNSFTALMCFRREELFDEILQIEKHEGRDVPENFNSLLSREGNYEETHFGITTKSKIGPLKYVTSEKLATLVNHEGVNDNPINKATWSYLNELEPNTKVALYWG